MAHGRRSGNLFLALAAGFAVCGAAVPAALAADSPPAAIAQYVEMVPTAGGQHPTDKHKSVGSLSSSTEQGLRNGDGDAGLLKKAATDSAYGAEAHQPKSGTNAVPRAKPAFDVVAVASNGTAAGAVGGLIRSWPGVLFALVLALAAVVGVARGAPRSRKRAAT